MEANGPAPTWRLNPGSASSCAPPRTHGVGSNSPQGPPPSPVTTEAANHSLCPPPPHCHSLRRITEDHSLDLETLKLDCVKDRGISGDNDKKPSICLVLLLLLPVFEVASTGLPVVVPNRLISTRQDAPLAPIKSSSLWMRPTWDYLSNDRRLFLFNKLCSRENLLCLTISKGRAQNQEASPNCVCPLPPPKIPFQSCVL